MSSTIEEIYTALDGMAVTFLNRDNTSTTATCYGLSESLDSVETAQLPARLLILPQVTQTLGPGPESESAYTIQDLFLLETVARGEGTKVQNPVLLRYIKAYQDAIALKWRWLSGWQTEAFSTTITLTPGKYEYPSQSGVWFYGVMASISINEIF
jgi:hypothetical protein